MFIIRKCIMEKLIVNNKYDNKKLNTFILDSSIDNIDIYNPEYIINQQY